MRKRAKDSLIEGIITLSILVIYIGVSILVNIHYITTDKTFFEDIDERFCFFIHALNYTNFTELEKDLQEDLLTYTITKEVIPIPRIPSKYIYDKIKIKLKERFNKIKEQSIGYIVSQVGGECIKDLNHKLSLSTTAKDLLEMEEEKIYAYEVFHLAISSYIDTTEGFPENLRVKKIIIGNYTIEVTWEDYPNKTGSKITISPDYMIITPEFIPNYTLIYLNGEKDTFNTMKDSIIVECILIRYGQPLKRIQKVILYPEKLVKIIKQIKRQESEKRQI